MGPVEVQEQRISDEIQTLLKANRRISANGSTLWIGDVCITIKRGSALLRRLHDLALAIRNDDDLD